MYDCFEHVALVDRWIVDYFSRILWKQFEAFGTVGNTWVDTFIRERYVSNSTVDLKSDNISGGMLETRSKLLINFMCRLSSGGSGASLHITKSDGGGGGSSQTLTELEEAVDLLDQIVNVVNPVINASEIMNLKLMLKQQAVYMCCREERFDVAARVFLRLWRNWKTEREMELRQNIAEVLDSRNRRHHHLETLPYSVMIEKCKVFLRKIYNDMPTPFLMNAADNVWKRVNQSSVSSSEPLADRLQAAEMRNQTLGMEIETDSPADVQSIPTNIVDLTIKERKKKKKAKKIAKAEFPNYKMSFGKVEAKTQFPQQQQPMNSVHQSMMPGNCQMLFWAGGQMGMPISMDGSNMMMSDQRQPMMMSYLKGEKSATDDWSNVIAPGPSGVFMDPSNANINGQPIIYIAAPNMQFDQNGVLQICMDPFQMASNMAIQNNMFLSNATVPAAAAAASSSAVASTSAAATSVTAELATQPNEEPSDRIRLKTKLIKKKKKGHKSMWYSYKKPLQSQQPQQQLPQQQRPQQQQASTNKSSLHEPIKTKTKPLNQVSPVTRKVIGTIQVDTRRMSKAKEKESAQSSQSVPSNPTGSRSPPRKAKVAPTPVQSNVLPPKRTRYSEPIQNSKPNTVTPVRKEKKPYIDPIIRENLSSSVPPSPKRARSDIALRRETSYLTVQTKTLRSKVIEMNLPNNSETARLLSKTKADKGKQKVGIKTNPSPVKQDLMVSLTKTKVDAIVSKAAKVSLSTTLQQREHKTQPQQKQGKWPSSSHEALTAPWTVAEEIQLCKGVKRLGNNEWKKLCKLYLPHRIASEAETKWERMAKAKKHKKK